MAEFNLDIRTLAFVTILFSIIYCIGLLLIQRMQKPIAGLKSLAYSILITGLGFLILSMRDFISPWATIILANTLICLGSSLTLYSLTRFRHAAKKNYQTTFILFPITLLLILYFTFISPSTSARIIIVSAYLAFTLTLCAWVVIKGKAQDLKLARVMLAAAFICESLFMVFRIIWSIHEPPPRNFMQAGMVHQLALLIVILIIVTLSFSVPWMINARLVKAIENLSIRDSLTKLYNRRALDEVSHKELSRAQRHNMELSIIMSDIDHFKLINDSYGHQMGDHVLRQMASILRRSLREEDMPFRYGGEEFLVLLPNTSLTDANNVAEKIRETIEEQLFVSNKRILWTASFGVTQLQVQQGESWEDLVERADKALYQAKKEGRNKVIKY